jgi:hypothetical protein
VFSLFTALVLAGCPPCPPQTTPAGFPPDPSWQYCQPHCNTMPNGACSWAGAPPAPVPLICPPSCIPGDFVGQEWCAHPPNCGDNPADGGAWPGEVTICAQPGDTNQGSGKTRIGAPCWGQTGNACAIGTCVGGSATHAGVCCPDFWADNASSPLPAACTCASAGTTVSGASQCCSGTAYNFCWPGNPVLCEVICTIPSGHACYQTMPPVGCTGLCPPDRPGFPWTPQMDMIMGDPTPLCNPPTTCNAATGLCQ